MGTLCFARRLADFESAVNHAADSYFPDEERTRLVARSCSVLLKGLIKVDEQYPEAGIPELLSEVIAVYEQGMSDLKEQQDAEDDRRGREREAAERLHERVVLVECPACCATAGTECHSRNGGRTADHKARERAALSSNAPTAG